MESRRIVAVVLPGILVDLGGQPEPSPMAPLGVVMTEPNPGDGGAEVPLDAVNQAARHLGAVEGQTIAEARAFVAGLVVRWVSRKQVEAALQTVAEAVMAFGTVVAIRGSGTNKVPDTVWVDITGVAHLFDGEAQLLAELLDCVRGLGHPAKVGVAEGPVLAQALARWGVRRVAQLPVAALPLDAERSSWLLRLGIYTWGDLQALPRAAAAARLGAQASQVLDLCAGRDQSPLVAFQPPRVLTEERSFEEPASGLEPLLFVVRGLVGRLAARLAGRGEAAQALVLTLEQDRAMVRLEGIAPQIVRRFELSPALWKAHQLYRLVAAHLERQKIDAPCVGVRLEVPLITSTVQRQLDFFRVKGGEELPVVLAELMADIGPERVGVLKVVDAHRPEAKSVLTQVTLQPVRHSRSVGRRSRFPTRLLPRPMPLHAALRVQASLFLGERAYTIERVRFERRLEAVEWWSALPTSRDYYRVQLQGAEGVLEALVFVDRNSGARYLHGFYD